MKVEDLKNTKIYLPNKDDRVRFQKKVFNLGVEWGMGTPRELITGYPFYYIDNNLKLSFDYLSQPHFFLECRYRQISLDEMLSIEEPKEEPKEECKFKPFDKVLVRDENNDRWLPREFSWCDANFSDACPFETIDGRFYKYCIPYDEKLANTTKNVK